MDQSSVIFPVTAGKKESFRSQTRLWGHFLACSSCRGGRGAVKERRTLIPTGKCCGQKSCRLSVSIAYCAVFTAFQYVFRCWSELFQQCYGMFTKAPLLTLLRGIVESCS